MIPNLENPSQLQYAYKIDNFRENRERKKREKRERERGPDKMALFLPVASFPWVDYYY